jgi:hypothetical protein
VNFLEAISKLLYLLSNLHSEFKTRCMKKFTLLLLCSIGCFSAFSQDPAAPCCGIIHTDSKNNIVTIRDKQNGLLLQFKVAPVDINSLRIGDAVSVSDQLTKITAINNVPKTYLTLRPNYAAPCCGVINIQMQSAAPCCGVVSYTDNNTGKKFTMSVPKEIATTLKVGDKISWDNNNKLAVLQSSFGGINRQLKSYGYPATPDKTTTPVAANRNANNLKNDPAPETVTSETDKWQISTVKTIRKGMGRLNLDFPPGVEWSVDIYSDQNKFIINRSHETYKQKSTDLPPGNYNFKLNTVLVENVPVEEGKSTRLKSGIHEVGKNLHWELRSEDNTKFLTSGNKLIKMALPVGSYTLIEEKIKNKLVIADGVTGNAATQPNESTFWIVYNINVETSLGGNFFGTNFQMDNLELAWKIRIYDSTGTIYDVISTSSPAIAESQTYSMGVGRYNMKLNEVPINNVPLEEGSLTFLKAGYVYSSANNATWRLCDVSRKPLLDFRYSNFEHNDGTIFPVPPGSYLVQYSPGGNDYAFYPIAVRYEDVIDLSEVANNYEPTETDSWIMHPTQTNAIKGSLSTDFAPKAEWKIQIFARGSKLPFVNLSNSTITRNSRSYSLAPGKYRMVVSGVQVDDVQIKERYETRLKAGYISVIPTGPWSISRNSVILFSGNATRMVMLPVGRYDVSINGQTRSVTVVDNETIEVR